MFPRAPLVREPQREFQAERARCVCVARSGGAGELTRWGKKLCRSAAVGILRQDDRR